MGYLSVLFSNERRPQGSYPGLLCKYLIDHYFKDSYKTILDVGCGKGIHMREFQKLGYKVKGVDKLEEAIELSPDLNIEGVDMEWEALPFDDDSFDVVLSKSCLEHIHYPDNNMKEMYRVLKPRGRLIIQTPDYAKHKSFYADHTHVVPYVKESLTNLLLIYGFKVIEVKRFIQIPFLWKYPWLSFVIPILRCFPEPKNPLSNYFNKWVWSSRGPGLNGIGEK